MLCASYTPTLDWYLSLDWQRHARPKAVYWIRELLRTDIIMSAMFKSSHRRTVTIAGLVAVIGAPDWVEGSLMRGAVYYRLYRMPGDPNQGAMYFGVVDRTIRDGGTNAMSYFKVRSALRTCR